MGRHNVCDFDVKAKNKEERKSLKQQMEALLRLLPNPRRESVFYRQLYDRLREDEEKWTCYEMMLYERTLRTRQVREMRRRNLQGLQTARLHNLFVTTPSLYFVCISQTRKDKTSQIQRRVKESETLTRESMTPFLFSCPKIGRFFLWQDCRSFCKEEDKVHVSLSPSNLLSQD